MPTRKRSHRDSPPPPEVVTSEPILIGDGRESVKHNKLRVYQAVDYLGTRFRIGDHVALYSSGGKDWVCVLETLFKDSKSGQACFKGRWFWTVGDIVEQKDRLNEGMRESRCSNHELIAGDQRDDNLVESISRKCTILSWDNFQLVRKIVTKNHEDGEKIYYCDRQFYHKAGRFSELNSLLFPGDEIPAHVRKSAGLPELAISALHVDEESVGCEHALHEPEPLVQTRRRGGKGNKGTGVSTDPIVIW